MGVLSKSQPIGIFDSGIGGFTVLSEIRSLMPHEDIIYMGDTARVPYGSKSQNTVIQYSEEILGFLLSQQVKYIIIACNTASSYALEHLKSKTQIPIMGVVEPGVNALVRKGENKQKTTAALIATRGTVKSNLYQKLLNKQSKEIQLVTKACPLFVPLVEEGLLEHEITLKIIRFYLDEFHQKNISNIILGCTHYPLLKKSINSLYPEFCLIDSSKETANALKYELTKKNLLSENTKQGKLTIYVSDITDTIKELKSVFLKDKAAEANLIFKPDILNTPMVR